MAKYWDIKRTISYNALFNFIIGMRGAGKTYGALKECVEHYMKTGKQFMYVRRMKTELDKLTTMRNGRLFNAVAKDPAFKDITLSAESNTLYLTTVENDNKNKQIIGYAQPLSTASILKSDAFPDVDTILFDEFIIDNSGTYHYLKDEVTKFFDLYETVARGRDVRVFFLSNAVTLANPYFDFFHLNKPYNGDIQRFGKNKDILVQNVVPEDLSNEKKHTRFGKIIADTEYSDYAYSNEWLLDNNDFIEKKTARCTYFLTLRYRQNWIGIWLDELQWVFYVSTDVDLQFPRVYSATTDDHKPNIMLFKAGKKLGFMKNLIEAYQCGCVRYENLKLKNWFRDIMRMAG